MSDLLDAELDVVGESAPAPAEDEERRRPRRRRPRRRRWRRARVDRHPGVEIIEARQPGVLSRVREFWHYRRLTLFFGWQFVEKLYRNTLLGLVWIPLRPALSVGVRALVFGSVLGAPSDGVPYFLFFIMGLATWQMFAFVALWGTRSLEQARSILRRMYVPRLTALVGALVPALVNLALNLTIVLVAVVVYLINDGTTHFVLGPELLLAPLGVLLCALLGLAIASWTAVFGAQTRDMRFTMTYVLSFWFFFTPIIYPLSQVPESLETAAGLNPMTLPVELVRYGCFGAGTIPESAVLSCVLSIVIIGVPGLWFFNRSESRALDAL